MLAGKKRSRKSADAESAQTKKKPKAGKGASVGAKSSSSSSTNHPNPTSLLDCDSIDFIASPCGRTSQPIRTPVLSGDDKDILIDRLTKEVVDKFGFTLSRKVERTQAADGGAVTFTMGSGGIKMAKGMECDDACKSEEDKDNNKGKNKNKKKKRPKSSPIEREPTLADLVVKKRLIVGVNQCTRALEAAAKNETCKPSLVLLSRDVRPPTILAHIPILCQQMDIPAVVLPGRASAELGKAVGGRSVAVAVLLPRSTDNEEPEKKTATSVGDGPSASEIQECHRRIDSYVKFALSKIPSSGGK